MNSRLGVNGDAKYRKTVLDSESNELPGYGPD